MRAAGCDVQRLTALDWRQDFLWNVEQERIDSIVQDLTRYFRTQTKAHLFDLARETGLMMAPVNTIEDLFNDEQLHARGYWQSAPGDAEDLHYPGPAVRLSGTPLVSGAVAPSLGQHNEAVYGQWAGLSPEQVRRLHSAGCV
jgi:CoA:oxalate CoA-transferase